MVFSILKQLSQVFTWFVVVAPWEQAIRVRLGKNVRLLNAGIYVKVPFIDRVFKQSTRRRLNMLRPQTLTTADRHVVTCAGAVGYSIGDLVKLYDTLESPNGTIENEIAGLVAKYLGARNLKECSSAGLEQFVKDGMDLTKYGLNGQEFYLTSFATSKTYRFITGGMESWGHDGGINMEPAPTAPHIG